MRRRLPAFIGAALIILVAGVGLFGVIARSHAATTDPNYGSDQFIQHDYITWYGFNDNSCSVESQHSCDDISFPKSGGFPTAHNGATEGTGTYSDPITFATAAKDSGSPAEFVPGTIIYVPFVHKYFIMEDQCFECGQEWFTSNPTYHTDLWMGPPTASNTTDLDNCENNLTLGNTGQGTGVIYVNPVPNYPVDTNPIFTNNQCTAHTYPNAAVTPVGATATPTNTPTTGPTSTPTTGPTATPVTGGITNGGFETGNFSGWTTSGAATSISTSAHTGSYAAQGGKNSPTNGDSNISQTFTVPSGSGTLSFWYKVVCPDDVTYDWATATLKDNTTGTTTTPLAKTCNLNNAWVQVSAGVTAGHSYTLTLTSHDENNPGDPTYTLFDGVALSAGASNPITNGGFETGNFSGWTTSGAATSISTSAHTGSYAGQAGKNSPTNGDSNISQTFTAPSGSATVSFWYKVVCPDDVAYDWATASLKDNTAGTSATILAKTCNTNNAWVKVSASITAGHSYTLTLTSHDENNPGDPTYTLFDDVSVS